MSRILVIDDEPTIGWGLSEYFRDLSHDVVVSGSVEAAFDATRQFDPDAIFVDVRLPGQDGLSAIGDFRRRWGPVPIVVMTAFGNLETAIQSVQQGAVEYLTKPFDLEAAGAAVSRALAQTRAAAAADSQPPPPPSRMIGRSPAMQGAFRALALASACEVPVLIHGEPGTGKELAASVIHAHQQQRTGPFVAVSPRGKEAAQLERELFGAHGQSTDVGELQGAWRRAQGGTLFVDELADVPLAVQSTILRAIETPGAVTTEPLSHGVPVRWIFATQHRPEGLVQKGQLREDLAWRLSSCSVSLPPLCERREDIPLLAQAIWDGLQSDGRSRPLPDAVTTALAERPWAGNLHELRATVEAAALRAWPGLPELSHFAEPSRAAARGLRQLSLQDAIGEWVAEAQMQNAGELHRQFLNAVEPLLLEAALERCEGNRAAAARWLGIDRTTLRTKLRTYGIDRDNSTSVD